MTQREQPFSLRVSKEAMEAYKRAAEKAGLSVSEWARHVLDVSSGHCKIRHVYYIDVGNLKPKEAFKAVKDAAKKVREGKW